MTPLLIVGIRTSVHNKPRERIRDLLFRTARQLLSRSAKHRLNDRTFHATSHQPITAASCSMRKRSKTFPTAQHYAWEFMTSYLFFQPTQKKKIMLFSELASHGSCSTSCSQRHRRRRYATLGTEAILTHFYQTRSPTVGGMIAVRCEI